MMGDPVPTLSDDFPFSLPCARLITDELVHHPNLCHLACRNCEPDITMRCTTSHRKTAPSRHPSDTSTARLRATVLTLTQSIETSRRLYCSA
jgi:hypothetical protein